MLSMTQKLLAIVSIAGTLLVGAATEASANPWRASLYAPRPVVVAPVYAPRPVVAAPVYAPRPVVVAPLYRAPIYVGPAPSVVYPTPAFRPIGWHRHHWVRPYGHRW